MTGSSRSGLLIEGRKTGKALYHNAFPVLLAHSHSITDLRLPLYIVGLIEEYYQSVAHSGTHDQSTNDAENRNSGQSRRFHLGVQCLQLVDFCGFLLHILANTCGEWPGLWPLFPERDCIQSSYSTVLSWFAGIVYRLFVCKLLALCCCHIKNGGADQHHPRKSRCFTIRMYVVPQEQLTAFALGAGLFSAQHPPLKAGWGLTFLAFSGHAEMHRIQEIPTRWHRAALAPLPDLMDGFHRSVHAGLFPIPAKNSRQPWRIPDTASR